jgi:ABC-2 type transport system permease protein
MTNISITLNVWVTIIIACVKRSMNYRSNFILSLFDALVWLLISVSFFFILIANFNSVGGYGKYEIITLIGISEIIKSFVFAFFVSGISKIPGLINSGELDLHITRPINLGFYLCTKEFELPELLSSIPGAFMIIWGMSGISEIQMTSVLGMFVFLLLSIFIIVNFWLALVSVGFWTKNQTNVNEIAIAALSLIKYPKTVYSGIGKFILTFIIPVSILANAPMDIMKNDISINAILIFLVIVAFSYLLRKLVWTLGLKSYDSASL